MKTYLISQEQIKQFVALLIVAILAVFFAGYYLGGLGATSSLGIKSLSETESADKSAAKANNLLDAQTGPGETKPGDEQKTQNNKTDSTGDKGKAEQKATEGKKRAEQKKAEKEKAAKLKAEKKKAEKEKAAKLKAERKKAEKAKAKAKRVQKAKDQAKKEAAEKAAQKQLAAQNEAGQKAASTKPVETVGAETTKTTGRRYYSIQAGMFASKVNASSFISKLAEKDFTGYVSNFVSTSGAVKYNVRVGHFEQRDQARALLREFQKSFSSPAYVVITDNRPD